MKIFSIFRSFNGECCHAHQGSPCVFIRMSGCNLDCKWPCDSKKARNPQAGKEMTTKEIVKLARSFGCVNYTITGGEPLLQKKGLHGLILALVENEGVHNTYVSVETNGSFLIPEWHMRYPMHLSRLSWVADYKLSSSGMEDRMNIKNYKNLTHADFIKFVIDDLPDYLRAKQVREEIIGMHYGEAKHAFSPTPNLNPKLLASWMIRDNVNAILSLQIHKIIGLTEDSPE